MNVTDHFSSTSDMMLSMSYLLFVLAEKKRRIEASV